MPKKTKWEKMVKKVVHSMLKKCAYCGGSFQEPDITFGPDPYASEIHDDNTPRWICSDCYRESVWSV